MNLGAVFRSYPRLGSGPQKWTSESWWSRTYCTPDDFAVTKSAAQSNDR